MRPLITASTIGTVYLLHLSAPLGNLANARAQAQHYIGFCLDLDTRIKEHRAGWGSKLLAAAVGRGITFEVVATWTPAPLAFEKALKRRKEAPKLCPVCCRAAGRSLRPLPVPCQQLELPIDLDDFPPAPTLKMDWLEVQILRGWRQAGVRTVAGLDNWDDGLL